MTAEKNSRYLILLPYEAKRDTHTEYFVSSFGFRWLGRFGLAGRSSGLVHYPLRTQKDHVISSLPEALGSYNVYSVYSATILDHHRQLFKD